MISRDLTCPDCGQIVKGFKPVASLFQKTEWQCSFCNCRFSTNKSGESLRSDSSKPNMANTPKSSVINYLNRQEVRECSKEEL